MRSARGLVSFAVRLGVLTAALSALTAAAQRAADAPGTLQAQRAAAGQRRPAPPPKFSARQLMAPPVDGWITNGGNVYNQRYSPLDRINRDNVALLRPKWRTQNSTAGIVATL